jgi:hypothetical protein
MINKRAPDSPSRGGGAAAHLPFSIVPNSESATGTATAAFIQDCATRPSARNESDGENEPRRAAGEACMCGLVLLFAAKQAGGESRSFGARPGAGQRHGLTVPCCRFRRERWVITHGAPRATPLNHKRSTVAALTSSATTPIFSPSPSPSLSLLHGLLTTTHQVTAYEPPRCYIYPSCTPTNNRRLSQDSGKRRHHGGRSAAGTHERVQAAQQGEVDKHRGESR